MVSPVAGKRPEGRLPRDRKIEVTISSDAERRLVASAAAAGLPVSEFAAGLLERLVALPTSLDETLRPIRQAFAESGMTDDELGKMLEEEIDATRRDRNRGA